MKIRNLKIRNLKIQNLKIRNLNIWNLKIGNSKIQNSKIRNLKIRNWKLKTKIKIENGNWKLRFERACSIFLPRGTKLIQASVLELIQLFTSIWVHIDILCPYLPAQSHSCSEKIKKRLGQNDVSINCKSMHHFAPKWNLL